MSPTWPWPWRRSTSRSLRGVRYESVVVFEMTREGLVLRGLENQTTHIHYLHHIFQRCIHYLQLKWQTFLDDTGLARPPLVRDLFRRPGSTAGVWPGAGDHSGRHLDQLPDAHGAPKREGTRRRRGGRPRGGRPMAVDGWMDAVEGCGGLGTGTGLWCVARGV